MFWIFPALGMAMLASAWTKQGHPEDTKCHPSIFLRKKDVFVEVKLQISYLIA